mmetsp:Transcript_12650/g.50816  ORF Transcript_12650/g.50816 Transcript_12650/m.50816 type:complete len:332 (-) Transcript_12650:129-1124(-)
MGAAPDSPGPWCCDARSPTGVELLWRSTPPHAPLESRSRSRTVRHAATLAPSRALAERSLVQPTPPVEEMQGVWRTYSQSSSRTAPMQKAATSARGMLPAWPSMTLTTPVGGSTVSPPGRTTVHSSSAPGAAAPAVKSASWAFLSVKMELMTVLMRILKKNGAWSLLSPVPIDVTTAIRLTPRLLHSSMTWRVPSASIVGPTSLVLPPSATMTPSTSPASNTFATSSALVTSPLYLKSISGDSSGLSAAVSPHDPSGVSSRAGSRHSARTFVPRSTSWYAHSRPVSPVAPKTATLMCTGDDRRVGAVRSASPATREAVQARATTAVTPRGL